MRGSVGRTVRGFGTTRGTSCSSSGIRRNTQKLTRKQKGFKKQVADILFEKGYHGPTLRVHSFRIEPVAREWPPKSHTALYGTGPIEEADLKKLFHAFAERAYRRPVAPEEVETFVELAEQLEADGNSRQEAMKGAYAAMLCSPDFVYLRQEPGKLDDFALASRLSYFLWSSMPDEALMELARAGKLANATELERQVERMLKDPKAAAFVRHFPERWLKLYELGQMEPDKQAALRPLLPGEGRPRPAGRRLLPRRAGAERSDPRLHRFRLHVHEPAARRVDLRAEGGRGEPAQGEVRRSSGAADC